MASQNMVSGSIAPAAKQEILEAVAGIKGKLDFLLSLQAGEVMGLFKAGKEYGPFIDECHQVAKDHPEIVPGIFDKQEYDRDWQLARDLGAIADSLNQLSEAVNHTLTAVRSDAMVASLDVYAAVKLNRDKVAGLNSAADRLGAYFKKAPRAASAAKAR